MSNLLRSGNFRERLATGLILAVIIIGALITPEANAFRLLFAFFGIMVVLELGPIIERKIFCGEITDDRCFVLELIILFFGVLAVFFMLERREIILVLLVSVVNDTGAYFVGNLFHNKFIKSKPFPRVSPKKSWEGIIGGYLLAIVVMLGLKFYFNFDISLLFIIFAPAVAIFGDFLESFVKRALGIKDSNELILKEKAPILSGFELAMSGHGGYADRIDSWTAVACFMLIVKFIEK